MDIIRKTVAGLAILAMLVVCMAQPIAGSQSPNKISPSSGPVPQEIIYKKPQNYSQLVSWYKDLEKNYSGFLEVFDANTLYNTGNATGGYNLTYIRITNESSGFLKPEVFIMGPPHGDETAGTAGAYWFVNWSMRTAFDPLYYDPIWTQRLRWYFENREIYIESVHNPYGLDHGPQRYDANGWDLNRETDYDCCGTPSGGRWASANSKTVREFIENHQIRIAADFHGGIRAMISPWHSNHDAVQWTCPISGKSYSYAPPDFNYYQVGMHKIADFIGPFGGAWNSSNIGPMGNILGYKAQGAYPSWGYAADVMSNPLEDPFVDDETFGNYNGSGIYFTTFEISVDKDVTEQSLGGDTTSGYGIEARRFMLYTTEMAQPYLEWMPTTVKNGSVVMPGTSMHFSWDVNGSMVVDNTYVQWGSNPDPAKNANRTKNNTQNAGKWFGGTGWDNPSNGQFNGVIYDEDIIAPQEAGTYYYTARAIVDQRYNETIAQGTYGKNHTYLRSLKERLWGNWSEEINGTDGKETMKGRLWWDSPTIQVTVPARPMVIETYPVHNSTNISRTSHVFVNFSKEMDKVSAQSAFSISPYKSGSFTWGSNNTSMEFTPTTPFTYSRTYTVTIQSSAKDMSGLNMSQPYVFWFTIMPVPPPPPPPPDTYSPYITYVFPGNGSIDINISTVIVISFNESMNQSATESAVTLSPSVPLAPAWIGNSLRFTHTTLFAKSTNYTMIISQAATDIAGNQLDQVYTVLFRTEVAPPPPPPPPIPLMIMGTTPVYGAMNVDVNTSITILFNVDVDKYSLKWSIAPNAFATTIVVNKTVTFVPFTNFTYNTTYTLTIFKETRSTAGARMNYDYPLTFTTEKETQGPAPPLPQEPFTSTPWFWFAVLAIIVVITLVLLLLILFKGKKKEKPQENASAQPPPPPPQP